MENQFYKTMLRFNEGNWWGRITAPGFVAGVDSNAVNVIDSYSYLVKDGWDKGYGPGEPEFIGLDTIVVFTDSQGIATCYPFRLGPVGEINLITANLTPFTYNLASLTFKATATTQIVPAPVLDPICLVTSNTTPSLWGMTQPNYVVSIYTLDGILVITTTADSTGNWSVQLPYSLNEGSYDFLVQSSYQIAGIYSNYGSITITIIFPPSNLIATAISSSQINLIWTDNSNNEQGFKIERKLRCDQPYTEIATVGADVTSYSDTGLRYATNHYYRVKAYNESGDSDYSNESPAITFAPPVPTPDEINSSLTQYYQNGQMNVDIYNALSAKLNEVQSFLNAGDYQSAVEKLNEISDQILAEAGQGINTEIVRPLLNSISSLTYKTSLQAALPLTISLYLTSGECENNVVIKLSDGNIVSTRLVGYITINLQATNNADIATFTIQDSKYVGSSFSVNGIDFGKVYVEINGTNPGSGTFNLQTGEINVVERVLISSSYTRALGMNPIPFELPQKGVVSPINLTRGKVELIGLGTLPPDIPLIGGAQVIACSCAPAPFPGLYHCPPLPTEGEGKFREDADGDGTEDVLDELLLDEEGNRIELWVTARTFRFSYSGPGLQTPATRRWIGGCDYEGGEIAWVEPDQEDTDGNNKTEFTVFTVTNFDKGVHLNSDGSLDYGDDDGDGKLDVTQYIYDPQTGTLKVIHYEIPYPTPPAREPGETDADYINRVRTALQAAFWSAVKDGSSTPEIIYEGPAQSDVEKLPHDRRRPPDYHYQGEAPAEFGPGLCSAAPHTGIFAETFIPPVWNYYLYPYTPAIIKTGDTMMITGEGITGATVNGGAVLPHNGGWHVKEVTPHYAIFEATSETIITGPVSGFSVTAPDSIPGFIHSELSGENVSNQGMAIGPVAIWEDE